MGKTLIIAEKPSVANDLQKVIGGMERVKADAGDYFEGEKYVVASAVGHLLELAVPEKYDVKRGKWTFAHLPLIPPEFELKPIAKSASRLKLLAKLIRRKDITGLINACDAGREGELIFRYIVQATRAKQPIQRLWLQSMTPGSIREAFRHLRSDAEMQPLAAAAKSRSEADWLVGINGTRALTAFNSKNGGFFLTTVGRVQTPTLAVVVNREAEIRAFRPKDYWQVEATFRAKAGEYTGVWFDPAVKGAGEQKPERIWERAAAEAAAARCRGASGTVEESSKRVKHAPPVLFDLTTLQREANNRFGFTAKTTLALAQSLYEKHKVLSYPRTDAKCLPTDYVEEAKKTLGLLAERYGAVAKKPLSGGWVKPNPRIFNTAKISDHFALVPLPDHLPSKLSEPEAKIYDLVAKRFMAIFYPPAEVDETTRVTTVGSDSFRTRGKVLVKAGWREVYGGEAGDEGSLPPVAQGEKVKAEEAEVVAKTTLPPPRYTEATLLSAMEGAGKMVEDDALRSAMQEKGIGTPATRAAIIEGLIVQKYLIREGRELRPTAKAFQLLTLLKGLKIEELSEPELTGEWESRLAQIEKGTLSREEFMTGIRGMTEKIVDAAKQYEGESVPLENPVHLKHRCPKCGGEVVENFRRYACTNPGCDFSISKHPGGRTFEPEEVEELLEKKQIGPLQGFVSKMGRPFAAVLKLSDAPDCKLEFVFDNPVKKDADAAPVDFTGLEPVGKCPVCGGRVFGLPMAYMCENTQRAEKKCSFRVGKVILQQPVAESEMKKLLEEGRTSLLKGFVSNKTHRKFSAYLKMEKGGKVGFEFEDREAKGTAAKKRTVRATASKAVRPAARTARKKAS
ncbi:MAG: DNA topoisomerase III [Sutterellaceae bacterium]|nr:DNA topoisomerase III [Sutterellaceae bacterium]MDD7442551.1 DNA topoisomerase III [Sutterellaceae bacterium]MDY2867195.1 DNA topoisomerase III [Mesosutterella sp.]